VVGKYTLHTETNDSGKMFYELTVANNFIIKNTCFNHKRMHKGTWKIPGSEPTNQTDHVLLSRKHGSSILDVISVRGPNCDSDHHS
jgi:hypothetical protein